MGAYVSGLAFPDIAGRFVVPKLGIKRSGFRVEELTFRVEGSGQTSSPQLRCTFRCVPPTLDCSQFFGFPSFNRRPL